jgi:addiction module RelE/StbE family toxin
MKPVWARAAIRDLASAREYIARVNPDAAREIALGIVDATERIIQFPEIGRTGRMKGTRELVVSGTQYLIVYRLKKTAIHFLRVLHGHQKWPRGKAADL